MPNQKNLKTQEALRGFKYLYGEDYDITKNIINRSASYLEKNQFEEIVTPFLVDQSLIVGQENRPVSLARSEIVFNVLTVNNEKLALRYENTLPVCKCYVDNFATDKLSPLKKFYYISPQFRNEKEIDLNGRLRQFYQIGWEIIGGEECRICEAIKVGEDILSCLKLKHSIRISEVNILNNIFDALKLNKIDRHTLLDIFDSGSLTKLSEYMKKMDISVGQKKLLVELITSNNADSHKINMLKQLLKDAKCLNAIKGINLVEEVFDNLMKYGCKNIVIDFSFVRSNKFYSGIIFQYYTGGNNHECGGGGEYNRIIKSLNGPDTLSCGAAFGLERIVYEYKKEHSD
jgi:histidyl-tRNA synthetase